ncbi:MAG: penicillin-binding protein 2 [Lactobacillaceae bacterium]|jgi:penicillin-binding protein 2|nr:penicillin-binding protein 2 [Lactobacillaceae bacterium]
MMNRDNDKGRILIKRALIMAAFNFFIMLAIILRLYHLQVYQADRYKTLADRNRISTRILIPHRGRIFDRNNEPLAVNQQNFQALIVAEQTTSIDETLKAFNEIMPLTEGEIDKIKKDLKKNKSFVPIKIKDNLSWEDMAKIQLHSSDLPGIFVDEGLLRHYPYGELTAHILGYVSYVTKDDLKKENDPLLEVPDFRIGRKGLEKTFEKKLRGKGGNLKLEVNAFGRIMQEIQRVDGIAGEDVTLSIDVRLQKKAHELFKDESGAAIVMDVNTGEVISFSSFPSFDPNLFIQGISTKDWEELQKSERNPLSNKAVSGQYSPGSTFKMVVALAALTDNIISTTSTEYCSGKTTLGNHIFHCWKHDGHGRIDLVEAIKHSCDIYFYNISQKLGIDKIYNMADKFGLGKKTGIGLDDERDGLIPNKDWKMKRFGEAWQQGESMISGIGQGYILTTPIQLAKMMAMIANNGVEVEPTFIKQNVLSKAPESLNIQKKYFDTVKAGMYEVVNISGGTAFMSKFDYKGKKMGGKTGTTQVKRISLKERQSGIIKQEDLPWKFRNHALFVGYAPHNNPKYAVVVIVEHGRSGSAVAAPIASKLLLEALKLDDEDIKE